MNVPYKGSITRYYTCMLFLFNDNVYKIILHVFSSWVCDLLDIMKINVSNLSTCLTIFIKEISPLEGHRRKKYFQKKLGWPQCVYY